MGISKYQDHYPSEIVRMGQEGKSQTQMAAALNVDRHTIADWAKDPKKPEFVQAMKLALTCAEGYWENIGQQGTKGILPKFNPSSWIYTMKCRFRDNWKDQTDSKIDISNTVKALTDEELDDTIKALVARKAIKDGSSGAPAQVSI